MNTLKSLSPNSTFTQLYSWWWLRPRPSSTPNPTSKLHCAKCQMCTGATDVAGHHHRLKDTGQQCLSAAALSCHCHPHHHQSSSSSSSLFSSTSLPSSSVIVSNHMCNMCQQRQPRNAQSRSTCRAGKSRRRFSTQKVLVSFLLFLLLLVSAAYGKEEESTRRESSERRSHQINLLGELNLHDFSYSGVSSTAVDSTHPFPSAIYFYDDSSRDVRLNSRVCRQAAALIADSDDITFLATVRQNRGNTGALLAFTDGVHRVLEMQSSGRRKELRFQYRQAETVFSETFAVDVADDSWHKIALTLSDTRLDLYIDCVHRYTRTILPLDRQTLRGAKNLTLWLGQRGRHHFAYQGYLRDVRIVSSANGFRAQCPDLETACPTCGQFKALKDTIFRLEDTVKHLTEKLQAFEHRLENVESCDCAKSCSVNGTHYADGSTWRQGCDNCTCSGGVVTCKKIKCENSCIRGVAAFSQQDPCCPRCKKQCYQKSRGKMNEGEKFAELNLRKFKCTQCVCEKDGKLNCRDVPLAKVCPPLNCSADRRIQPHGECCMICEGTDFCAQGHTCHPDAVCLNLRTNYTCLCKSGYRGAVNGSAPGRHTCVDVDECADERLNNCSSVASTCVNKPGSFSCRCKSGWTAVDEHRCIDIDECSTNEHLCGENAVCENTPGSYRCKCKEGYEGDGKVCKAVCRHSCLNGGQCVAPDTCSCRRGYYGHRCEADIDECSLGLHQCPVNSKCVNKPGWYHCDCLKGYEAKRELMVDGITIGHSASGSGHHEEVQCHDVDECASPRLNTCPGDGRCINFDGGYRCECTAAATAAVNQTNSSDPALNEVDSTTPPTPTTIDCQSCTVNGLQRRQGEWWPSEEDSCSTCHCSEGVVRCEAKECDCSDVQVHLDGHQQHCCPQCSGVAGRSAKVCLHQEDRMKVFSSGERWNYDCQTCECMNGEIDCWSECPPLMTNCLNPVRAPGDCCLRCEDDPCQSPGPKAGNGTLPLAGCRHLNKHYESGQLVNMDNTDKCTSCLCQNGRLCCSYSATCLVDGVTVSSSTFAPTFPSTSPSPSTSAPSSSTDGFNVSLQRSMSVAGSSNAVDQANHFPLGSIAGYMSRFFGDDQGQHQQRHHSPQPPQHSPPVEENLVEEVNDSTGDVVGGSRSSSGIGSSSHEVSRFTEEKRWKPLSFSESEPSIRKRHRAALVEGKLGHEAQEEEEEETNKEDFLADWSHEMATK